MTRTLQLAAAIFALVTVAPATPTRAFEIETGIDVLRNPATTIEGLHRLYIGRRVSPNLSFGGGVYSGALGDAGGAFFWGVEGVATLPLTDRLGLSLAAFLGGGGGAAQVIGDGTMARAALSLDYRLSRAWDLQASAAWVRIEGAPINGPALGLGLRYRMDTGTSGQPPAFDAIGATVTHLVSPAGTLNRPGGAQSDVTMAGVRAFHAIAPQTLLSFGGAGAVRGAQGYMELTGGLRQTLRLGRLSLFAEGSAGFAGGGLVDTGAGLILRGGLGVAVPVSRTIDAELAVVGTLAPSGDWRATGVTLGLTYHLSRRAGGAPLRWAYSAGIEMHRAGPGYFISPGITTPRIILHTTSFDQYIGRRTYLTGSATTAMGGGIAGFAVGMFGLGYELPLTDRLSLSVEGMLGAAGGGGVSTAGGLVAGVRTELDYRMGESWRLSAGLGHTRTLRAGGFAPVSLSLGVKIPFTTH